MGVDKELTRWELLWGGALVLGAHTLLAALVLGLVLSALWAGVVAVPVWIAAILLTPSGLRWLGRQVPALELLSAAYQRARWVDALVLGYAAGTLGLTVLLGSVRSVVFREDVVVRELLFSTALVVYLIVASLPGLLLLLLVPAWLIGLVSPWGLRFALGFAGFVTVAMGAVVIAFGPVHLVTDVLAGAEPLGPDAAGFSAPALFWGLYGVVTLLSVFTAMILSRGDGLRRPGERR
jgi:hypothetical protein